MRIFIKIFTSIFIIYSCTEIDCSKLPTSFTTYQEAIKQIRNTSFKFEDNINTSKSSWIRGAEFFSCDNETGFFILRTDSKDYIYEGLPVGVWSEFKQAESFGEYYNRKIKHNYQMQF